MFIKGADQEGSTALLQLLSLGRSWTFSAGLQGKWTLNCTSLKELLLLCSLSLVWEMQLLVLLLLLCVCLMSPQDKYPPVKPSEKRFLNSGGECWSCVLVVGCYCLPVCWCGLFYLCIDNIRLLSFTCVLLTSSSSFFYLCADDVRLLFFTCVLVISIGCFFFIIAALVISGCYFLPMYWWYHAVIFYPCICNIGPLFLTVY